MILITATVSVSAAVSFGHNHTYTDISTDDWFYEDIKWVVENYLSENDLMSGGDPRPFRPNELVTREQLSKMVGRFAAYHEVYKKTETDLSKFTDGAKVAKWAREDVEFSVGNGIIIGRTVKKLDPKGTATRAECCTMLRRFVETFGIEK